MRSKPRIPRTRHDLLVRHAFCRPRATAIEMRHALPPKVLAVLDLDTLAPISASYARPRLGPLDSDLVFTVSLREPRRSGGTSGGTMPPSIYFCLDHESTLDHLFPWRWHVYNGELWGRHIDVHSPPRPRTIPFIVSLLLAQHPARNTPTRLSDIIELPDFAREAFGAPPEPMIYVDDLRRSVLGDPLADAGHLALVEITRTLLYAYRNPSAAADPRVAGLGPLFDTVLACFGRRELEELLFYVLDVFGERSKIVTIIKQTLGRAVKEVYLTIAEKLRREGRAEGRKEGRKEGRAVAKAEAVLWVLRYRLGPIPTAVRKRVLSTTDEAQLRRWFHRALTASSLDEVFLPRDA